MEEVAVLLVLLLCLLLTVLAVLAWQFHSFGKQFVELTEFSGKWLEQVKSVSVVRVQSQPSVGLPEVVQGVQLPDRPGAGGGRQFSRPDSRRAEQCVPSWHQLEQKRLLQDLLASPVGPRPYPF